MINHNEFATNHHELIIKLGYWDNPKELGTVLMLIVTEISKLFDEMRLNRGEKLADVALRLYDLLAYYNVDLTDLPDVETCNLHGMISMLTNEMEANRSGIKTNYIFLKKCLSMVWKYAEENDIDLMYELIRKSDIISGNTDKYKQAQEAFDAFLKIDIDYDLARCKLRELREEHKSL